MSISTAATMGMGSLNFGLFINPMGSELNIGRSTFGLAQTFRQFSSSITAPVVGRMIDKYGSRILLPFAAFIVGICLIFLSFINYSWQMILLFIIMGFVGLAGPGNLVTTIPVNKWFVNKRAKAIAFSSIGIPIGALIFLPATQFFIDSFGWRNAWILLSIISMMLIIPISLFFLRRIPEDIGLLPDGEKKISKKDNSHNEISWKLNEATKNHEFWKLLIIFSFINLALGTIAIHRIPDFVDRGIDAQLVAFATALDAVAAGISIFVIGNLQKQIPYKILTSLGFILLTIASIITIYAESFFSVLISMIVFGFGIGGMLFLQNFIWADFFGRKYLGSIRGMVMPVTLIIGGIGAPLAGYFYDYYGNYNNIWWCGIILMSTCVVISITLKKPKK
tara:strand:- start:36 stop:1214 length:1179 start_codon:yes stop_codon:yes gene_type:complete